MKFFRILVWLLLSAYYIEAYSMPKYTYPRIMGVSIGKPAMYDDPIYQQVMSKVDVLIMGFWPKWKEYKYGQKGMDNVVKRIKKLNPNITIGQYTILNEIQGINYKDKTRLDIAKKVEKEDWWLRDVLGNKKQWTSKYGAFDINNTQWSKADKDGLRYPEWLARRNYKVFFQKMPLFEFWYLDNSLSHSPVTVADWNRNGVPDLSTEKEMSKAYRIGNVNYWDAILKIQPSTMLIGNSNDLSSKEYKGRLNGALLEALIGRSWSLESKKGWSSVMERYYNFINNTAKPKIVGFNVWGKADDYKLLRYGLASCLMGNGYFSYTDEAVGYGSIPWFDEYDINLGNPLEMPPNITEKKGIYRRKFEKGIVFVNSSDIAITVQVETGYRKFLGKQDTKMNNGSKVLNELTLKGRDGVILVLSE